MDETVVALYTEKSLITVRAGIYQLMNILEYFHQFSLFLLHTGARSVQKPLFHLPIHWLLSGLSCPSFAI